MTKKQKRLCRRLATGLLLALGGACLGALVSALPAWSRHLLFLPAYLAIGYDILRDTVRKLGHGQFLDENFLMTVASLGAFCCGEGAEGFAVMLFYRIGDLFESYAVGKSRRSVKALTDLRPDLAHLVREDGSIRSLSPEEVAVGQVIQINPGERIPLDGQIIQGSTAVNTAPVTGEALPRDAEIGDTVYSGCLNLSGVIQLRVSKCAAESTAARILELCENAASQKSQSERFITRFARVYTPIVVGCALLLAAVPPLFFGEWRIWIYRALSFLVVSCPCALVISVPLSFFGGIGNASSHGILIKGSKYMELLADAKCFLFDKTGTLSTGELHIAQSVCVSGNEADMRCLASIAEEHSHHPVARALRQAWKEDIPYRAEQVCEIAGQGVSCHINGNRILCGNARLMAENGIVCERAEGAGTSVHVAADGVYLGYFLLCDTPKENAQACIAALQDMGCAAYMLTGDTEENARRMAEAIGIDGYHSALMPEDKWKQAQAWMQKYPRRTVYVGDGINDTPVLSGVDVGIAMGGMGSEAAMESADVVLMHDNLSALLFAIRISKKTKRIAKQNIFFAILVKMLILILGAFGLTGMWGAVFSDVGVLVLAVLNAMRCLYFRAK